MSEVFRTLPAGRSYLTLARTYTSLAATETGCSTTSRRSSLPSNDRTIMKTIRGQAVSASTARTRSILGAGCGLS